MNADAVVAELAKPISLDLLSSHPARLAYTGLDGGPRVIPTGFHWDGRTVVMASPVNTVKVPALQHDPRVAITLDTADMPPRLLLIRGTAAIEIVDGVPDVFITASRKAMPDEMLPEWEAGVRALYDRMAIITITPTWAKLIDFETTLPQAVAEAAARAGQVAPS